MKKKSDSQKKPEKKKPHLRDLPKRKGDLTAEQARNVKGGDDPPPSPYPTQNPPPP